MHLRKQLINLIFEFETNLYLFLFVQIGNTTIERHVISTILLISSSYYIIVLIILEVQNWSFKYNLLNNSLIELALGFFNSSGLVSRNKAYIYNLKKICLSIYLFFAVSLQNTGEFFHYACLYQFILWPSKAQFIITQYLQEVDCILNCQFLWGF